MHPNTLYANVKRGFTYHQMTRDFFRSLKGAVQRDLLMMQKNQLFVQSVGADGEELGWYTRDNKKYMGHLRKGGSKFEMINTGELFDKMKVKISVGDKEIIFENTRKDIDKPWFRFDTDIFNTSEWFGLTEEHFAKFMDDYARPWTIQWTKNHIKYGSTNTTVKP